ncbi:MAG TPA: hypothetical protein VLI90_17270 [Tepidisphaeraceae bacterium]|nr:hypothetical protein [Tepidisphaeraceae bacterium]
MRLGGWFNGDFNYDGVVDGGGYAQIDNAFLLQGSGLAQPAAAAAGVLSVAAAKAPVARGVAAASDTRWSAVSFGDATIALRRDALVDEVMQLMVSRV